MLSLSFLFFCLFDPKKKRIQCSRRTCSSKLYKAQIQAHQILDDNDDCYHENNNNNILHIKILLFFSFEWEKKNKSELIQNALKAWDYNWTDMSAIIGKRKINQLKILMDSSHVHYLIDKCILYVTWKALFGTYLIYYYYYIIF